MSSHILDDAENFINNYISEDYTENLKIMPFDKLIEELYISYSKFLKIKAFE